MRAGPGPWGRPGSHNLCLLGEHVTDFIPFVYFHKGLIYPLDHWCRSGFLQPQHHN